MNPLAAAPLQTFDLLLHAGFMAYLVLALLLIASIGCWAIFLGQSKLLKTARTQNDAFLRVFQQAQTLEEIVLKLHQFPDSPVAAIFKNAVLDLRKMAPEPDEPFAALEPDTLEHLNRTLARFTQIEMAPFERYLPWLASTASVAPFIGLFGTVWGIMTSFQTIGATGSANLAVVAPGISEALITTAAGIATAIPAVLFYNHLSGALKTMGLTLEGFHQDFIQSLSRQILIAQFAPARVDEGDSPRSHSKHPTK